MNNASHGESTLPVYVEKAIFDRIRSYILSFHSLTVILVLVFYVLLWSTVNSASLKFEVQNYSSNLKSREHLATSDLI